MLGLRTPSRADRTGRAGRVYARFQLPQDTAPQSPQPAAIRRNLPQSAAVCRKPAAIRRSLLQSVAVCRNPSQSAAIRHDLPQSVTICRNPSQSAAIRRSLPQSVAICRSLPQSATIHRRATEPTRLVSPGLLKLACPNVERVCREGRTLTD
jgi:hypothetical protein